MSETAYNSTPFPPNLHARRPPPLDLSKSDAKLPTLQKPVDEKKLPETDTNSWLKCYQRLRSVIHVLPRPILATLIASILVVIKPIAFVSGEATYSFLPLTFLALFFLPTDETIGRQLEITILSFIGAGVAILVSIITYELGSLANRNALSDHSTVGRATPAVFLFIMSFVCGWVKSRYSRLGAAGQCCLFTLTWFLTKSITISENSSSPFVNMLLSVTFAAASGLVPTLLWNPQTSASRFQSELSKTIMAISEVVQASTEMFAATEESEKTQAQQNRQMKLAAIQTARLKVAYFDAQLEINVVRAPLAQFGVLVALLVKLEQLLLSQKGHMRQMSQAEKHMDELDGAAQNLAAAIAKSLHFMQKALEISLQTQLFRKRHQLNATNLYDAIFQLRTAVEIFQTKLYQSLDEALLSQEQHDKHMSTIFRKHIFRDAYFLTSVLEIATRVLQGLEYIQEMKLDKLERSYLQWPRIMKHKIEAFDHNTDGEGLDQSSAYEIEPLDNISNVKPSQKARKSSFVDAQDEPEEVKQLSLAVKLGAKLARVWNSDSVYGVRKQLASAHSSFRGSRHVKFAIKLSVGILLLSLPAYLSPNNAVTQFYSGDRGVWIPISYLYCLQMTQGATFEVAIFRTIGTISGAVYAYIVYRIVGTNPYGLVVFATFSSIFTAYPVIVKKRAGIGIVAAITIPPILFIPYLDLPHVTVILVACYRAAFISLGIAAALIINTLIWPYEASVQLVRLASRVTRDISTLYISMAKQNLRSGTFLAEQTQAEFEQLERKIQSSLARCKSLLGVTALEFSLLPKPIEEYARLIDRLSDILALCSGIRSIRAHIPRKLTVLDVMSERTELVSAVLISLQAVSHSLIDRSPVPQFLPSPRAALENLMSAVRVHIDTFSAMQSPAAEVGLSPAKHALFPTSSSGQQTPRRNGDSTPIERSSSRQSQGFSFAFAFAEHTALEEVIDALEETLDICRELYGVAEFITSETVSQLPEDSMVITRYYTPTPRHTTFHHRQRSSVGHSRNISLH